MVPRSKQPQAPPKDSTNMSQEDTSGSNNNKNGKKKKRALQSNLFAFFASNVPTPPKKRKAAETTAAAVAAAAAATTTVETSSSLLDTPSPKSNRRDDSNSNSSLACAPVTASVQNVSSSPSTGSSGGGGGGGGGGGDIPPPMVPTPTSTPRTITWESLHDRFVLMRRPAPMGRAQFFAPNVNVNAKASPKNVVDQAPRNKVAAIDLDGTLVVWNCTGYPSALSHYELWNTTVPAKLRQLYDEQGYQLLVVSNQAAIQRAHTGKKAQLVQHVINWIAQLIDRPLYAVISTQSSKKPGSFHKPSPKLWQVVQKHLSSPAVPWNLEQSFFVGDSVNTPEDPQGGVDAKFAHAVGIAFYTPTEFFGAPSDRERRQQQRRFATQGVPPPVAALSARSSLVGAYWKGPILLLLCGVQGSGKSTFCEQLLQRSSSSPPWVHLSQDTIATGGKPGKREQVEAAARHALQQGKCVVVDRMHLTVAQRHLFVHLLEEEQQRIPVHVLVLNPPKSVIAKRVRERTNHPGKVQGDDGVRKALQSLEQFVLPTYSAEPGITLISSASTPAMASRFADWYAKKTSLMATTDYIALSENLELPMVSLGTMNVGKRIAKETIALAISQGIRAIDTAPSYKNVDEVGEALASQADQKRKVLVIAKIPKSVVRPEQVRDSLNTTLQSLQCSCVDLLLLHWPCDVMVAGTLSGVWKEMEACYKDGLCRGLGVCNFNVAALSQLLAQCSIPPVIHQMERHPLCAQGDVVDFCARHGIHVQAHTPLGQGKDVLMKNEVVLAVAQETKQSPAAVLVQWNVQQGVSVVPKSQSQAHMQDLLQERKVLLPTQMERLDALDCGKRMVAPPFMYGTAAFCWHERHPGR